MKYIILYPFLLLVPSLALGITWFRGEADGTVSIIQPDSIGGCKKIIYRTAAKEELPIEHKRALLEKLIKGETVNNSTALADVLKQNPGFCSYGTNTEKFP